MISEIIFEQQGVTDLEAEIVNILKNDYDLLKEFISNNA